MIKGVPSMRSKINAFATKYPERVRSALFIEASIELTEAKKRTPVDVDYRNGRKPPHPGQLRRSGQVIPQERGNLHSVTLAFGGGAVDYARAVHEILDSFHPIGQAKFLESVINESRPYILRRVGKRLGLG